VKAEVGRGLRVKLRAERAGNEKEFFGGGHNQSICNNFHL
jgi:hypothetical protein